MARATIPTSAADQPIGIVQPVRSDVLDGERCDRCNAAARVMLVKTNLTLVLCLHHFTVNEGHLTGWRITADSRAALLAR